MATKKRPPESVAAKKRRLHQASTKAFYNLMYAQEFLKRAIQLGSFEIALKGKRKLELAELYLETALLREAIASKTVANTAKKRIRAGLKPITPQSFTKPSKRRKPRMR